MKFWRIATDFGGFIIFTQGRRTVIKLGIVPQAMDLTLEVVQLSDPEAVFYQHVDQADAAFVLVAPHFVAQQPLAPRSDRRAIPLRMPVKLYGGCVAKNIFRHGL